MLTCYSNRGVDKPTFSAGALATHVATNVAAKLGSAVFSVVSSFWGTNSPASQPRRSALAPAHAAPAVPEPDFDFLSPASNSRFPLEATLADPRRRVLALSMAPACGVIAATDAFGRVLLFDAVKMSLIRMWKGYRDAMVGWLLVRDQSIDPAGGDNRCLRRALFMVIYASRRGLLEIWPAYRGTRVGAFDVGLNCSLLQDSDGGLLSGRSRCFLVTQQGIIKEISVPFDCAAGCGNCTCSRASIRGENASILVN
jgi:hypothetical protein